MAQTQSCLTVLTSRGGDRELVGSSDLRAPPPPPSSLSSSALPPATEPTLLRPDSGVHVEDDAGFDGGDRGLVDGSDLSGPSPPPSSLTSSPLPQSPETTLLRPESVVHVEDDDGSDDVDSRLPVRRRSEPGQYTKYGSAPTHRRRRRKKGPSSPAPVASMQSRQLAPSIYKVGDTVEVATERGGRTWVPATITKVEWSTVRRCRKYYLVSYSSPQKTKHSMGFLKEYTSRQLMRPVPSAEGHSTTTTGDRVFAECPQALGKGSNTLGKGLALPSVTLTWMATANLMFESAPDECPSSFVGMASSEDAHSHDVPKEPQQLDIVLAEGSEFASVTEMDTTLPGLHNSMATNYTPNFRSPFSESIPHVGEIMGNKEILPSMVLSTNERSKTHHSQAHQEQDRLQKSSKVRGKGSYKQLAGRKRKNSCTDNAISKCPFIKKSSIWSQFDEMDVFKVTKHEPHFLPLRQEMPRLREGMAVGLMLAYSQLVEDIRESSIYDSMESFDEIKRTLSKFEDNGFHVEPLRNCLNELINVKEVYDQHLEEKDSIEAQQQRIMAPLSRKEALLHENHEAMDKLQQELETLHKNGQLIDKEIEKDEGELSRLSEVDSSVKEALDEDKQKFFSFLADL
ncbi:hypothetical protein ACP70R_008267 [Stipagrostis hirtigluma subsp. patula]